MAEIQSTNELKSILLQYFQSFFDEEAKDQKVAWCTSVGPSEILIAMGFKVYYPENHGALLGATRMANEFIPLANSIGYSPDRCSYLSSDIGSYLKGESPLTKVYKIPHPPKPDVLVYSTNQCHEVQDWFSFYAKEFDVPCFGIHPPWKVNEISESQLNYVESQFKELITVLEEITGSKLSWDKLEEVVNNSATTSDLWGEFLDKAKTNPSPITFFDGCIQMAPAVVLRGTPIANKYYKLLNQEIDEIILKNKSVPKEDVVRIYWDGMPIWGKLRFFSELLEKNNASAVASTYCNSWVFNLDSKDPLRSMASAYTKIFINRGEEAKEKTLKKLVSDFNIDGLIFHDAKTCPYNSNNHFALPKRLNKDDLYPHLIIDGDLNDLRCFSEEQTITSLESFIEQLKENRKG